MLEYGQRGRDIFEYGIESMITTINGVMTLPEALDHAEELYLGAAAAVSYAACRKETLSCCERSEQ